MTIEATLSAILAELKALNQAFAHIGAATRAPQGASQQNKAQDKPAAQGASQQNKAQDKPAAPQAPAGVLSYEKDVKPVALKLVAHNREKMVEILAKHGAAKAPDLKSDSFAAFIKDAKAALLA